MMSKEESYDYIKTVLQVDISEEKFNSNKLGLLNDIICAMLSSVPSQCISLMEKPLGQQCLPSPGDVKEACLQKVGGLCYTVNGFLFQVLAAVGYKVTFNRSTVVPFRPNNHIVVLVNNVLQDGDMYLVDVACGNPAFEAVSLDFDSETEIFENIFLEYKFTKNGDKITRLHKEKGAEDFSAFYEFVVDPTTDINVIESFMEYVYRDPGVLPFLFNYRALKFSRESYVVLHNTTLVIGTRHGGVETKDLDNDSQILKATKQYFPGISEITARRALANWRQENQK